MARKKPKGKKATQLTSARRTARKARKKPRKSVSKTSPAEHESRGAIDLLRSWSPARYSSR
jgi:hypothetical protein